MATSEDVVFDSHSPETLSARFQRVRSATVYLCRSLKTEDFVVQSMPDVSPTKWHLAHITWFFESFVLNPKLPGYRNFREEFHFLFNSYYYSVGPMHLRPHRGLLTRPTVETVMEYREHVDNAVLALLAAEAGNPDIEFLVTLGLHHEMQHQELMLTDIKHVFSCNPTMPAVNTGLAAPPTRELAELVFTDGPSAVQEIGAAGEGFFFDNETPRHRCYLQPHQVASRLVTNGEYLEFIRDGGYEQSPLWLSDGWSTIRQQGWNRPLYWSEDLAREFTMGGERELDLNAPVTHVSYYEAEAFARWAGCRLPTEAEWELAARRHKVRGNLAEAGYWHPAAGAKGDSQFFGDVWEWTSSSYAPYPGFKPLEGSLGEYNGKFMCNQMTVRGGSCVSATEHIRATYRSFFYPDARWQFLGLRLAKDA